MRAPPALALPPLCSIRDAARLKTELLGALAHESTVVVDAASLQSIDTACLQLLAAFARDRAAAKRRVEWRGVGTALLEALGVLGLGEAHGLPVNAG